MSYIRWLFFDLGSTLVDESAAHEWRFQEIAKRSGVPYEDVYQTAMDFYKNKQKGDTEAVTYYHVEKPTWRSDLETVFPDSIACLKALHGKYKLGVIANQLAGAKERLVEFGLSQYFDLVIASAEAGVEKPDLRIFEMALSQAGCMPDEAVMIGDRIDNDIMPAKKLGMKTVWVRRGFYRNWAVAGSEERPDRVVDTLPELVEIFESRRII